MYKRQGCLGAEDAKKRTLQVIASVMKAFRFLGGWNMNNSETEDKMMTVAEADSYTHLDVYKRQLLQGRLKRCR